MKTIELIPTDPDSESIVLILSGDTISVGNRNGTKYRLNTYDYVTLSTWIDDCKHYHSEPSTKYYY